MITWSCHIDTNMVKRKTKYCWFKDLIHKKLLVLPRSLVSFEIKTKAVTKSIERRNDLLNKKNNKYYNKPL